MNALPLDEVLVRADVWRGDRLASAEIPAVASGFAPLDAELPGGGWARGSLAEILVDGAGHGECSLLLPALGRLQEEGRWSLLVAPPHALHAPAWLAARIDLAHLVVVAPACRRDALWAMEQALASGALGAVLCWAAQVDARQVRRLQVAVAGSAALAFLFRPARAAVEPSAAALRLSVAATSGGRLTVDLFKRRGPPCARTLHLDVPRPLPWRENHESGPALARPAPAAPAARSLRLLAAA